MTEAGWYRDRDGQIRYWDGTAWTAHTYTPPVAESSAAATAATPGPGPTPASVELSGQEYQGALDQPLAVEPVQPAVQPTAVQPDEVPAVASHPAGWYETGEGNYRYWDGSGWTVHTWSGQDANPTSSPNAPGSRKRRATVWALGIGSVALVVVIALVAVFLPTGDSSRPSHPDQWDARLAPIARKVEEIRSLRFSHPVTARFLTDSEFTASIRSEFDKPNARIRRQAQTLATALRTVALAGPDADLLDAAEELTASSTLAYYDPSTEEIVVRGTKLDVDTKVTVAHELTHALQDQRFGLDGKSFTALVEGDATETELAYVRSLPQADQDTWAQDDSDNPGDAEAPAGVPQALRMSQVAPYSLGLVMVRTVADEGPGAVDRLFKHPPRWESAFVSPWTTSDPNTGISRPPPAAAREGDSDVRTAPSLDAYGLYLLLSTRLEPSAALKAADNWGGDRWQVLRRDGRDCSRLVVRARTSQGLPIVRAAFESWAAAMPPGAVSLEAPGEQGADSVTVLACEDPRTTPAFTAGAEATAQYPLVRNSLYLGLADTGLEGAARICVADALASSSALTGIAFTDAESLSADQLTAVRQAGIDAAQSCQAAGG